MAARRPVRLALDQNFPTPILAALAEFIVDIELIPLRRIDPRLSSLDDRTLVVALHQLGFPGLVTNNYKMLKNPKELAAIVATKLTVFAIEGVGDDPIRATGALLLGPSGSPEAHGLAQGAGLLDAPAQPDARGSDGVVSTGR